jgi:hypothetical protein
VKQYAVRIALGLAVLAAFLGHAAKFFRIPFVDQLDHIIYDTRLRLNERFKARGWPAIEIGSPSTPARCASVTWARSCARPTL